MVWVDEDPIMVKEDNMEAVIEVGKKNIVMKFDAMLDGNDPEEAEEKIKKAVDIVNWASFNRYNGIEPTGNVVVKDGSLHYIGAVTVERRTMTGKADAKELCRFLTDMLELSGIRRWSNGKATNELKDLVAGIRESVSNQYKITDDEYNKERLDFLVREELQHFYGDRDLANRGANIVFGSSIYPHNRTYERTLEKRDLYLEKDNKRYRLITIDELLTALHAANNQITIEEDLFNCNGKSLFIDSGSTITVKEGYNKCLDIIITKDGKTCHWL